MEARSILVVEDDSDINTLLARIMKREGHSVIQAFSGTEALLQLDHEKIDLILLDMMLPGMDGPTFIATLRNDRKLSVPVVVVSAKAGLSDKIDMLTQGADDYIVKPFEPEEVAARVQAVLRRVCGNATGNNEESYVYKDLRLDVPTRRVSLNDVELSLTAHEFDILHTLIQEPDKVFSRELLYELVWKGGYYGEDNAVNVHVSNIRKKLAAIDPQGTYVKTVWGIGFKLS
ncbi:MAG: response regulator transcription factor [Gordonibacter sp.]|nr:response regulator transcription factor [Gordonibacter sp.]